MKAFSPVADITAGRLGGLFSSGITYGAWAYQEALRVVADAGPTLRPTTAAVAAESATTAADVAPSTRNLDLGMRKIFMIISLQVRERPVRSGQKVAQSA
ncbi:hypothetical protein GCM10022223_06140 [Kineosporia mesophila]|uniref:Uncharacterized protein n=1 Tax=Kineosporia mesophila TaxID=566012 RepID=A0ABP6Z0F4_9ACTN